MASWTDIVVSHDSCSAPVLHLVLIFQLEDPQQATSNEVVKYPLRPSKDGHHRVVSGGTVR